jgi:hypothetical protein
MQLLAASAAAVEEEAGGAFARYACLGEAMVRVSHKVAGSSDAWVHAASFAVAASDLGLGFCATDKGVQPCAGLGGARKKHRQCRRLPRASITTKALVKGKDGDQTGVIVRQVCSAPSHVAIE